MRSMKRLSELILQERLIKKGTILLVGCIFSIVLTLVMVSTLSLIFHGFLIYDYLIIGFISSSLISLSLTYIFVWVVSKLKERHDEAVQSENYYHTLFNSIQDCVCIISPEGRFVSVNKTMCRVNGYVLPHQCIGKDFIENVVDNPDKLTNALHRALRGETVHVEYSSKLKDGTIVWWDSVFSPIQESDGSIKNILRISRDITEKKTSQESLESAISDLQRTRRASLNIMEDLRHEIFEHRKTEELLRQKTIELQSVNETLEERIRDEVDKNRRKDSLIQHQSRLAAMGEMIGAIAHQWRQPLNALGLIIQDFKDAYDFGELDRDYLQRNVKKGMEVIKSMSRTIDDFRNFFRPDKAKTEFDVKGSISSVLRMLSAQLKAHNISFRLTCHAHNRVFERIEEIIDCGEHRIEGYKNEFEHVIMNLINNAKDAFEAKEGPGLKDTSDDLITIDVYKEGDRVIVTVKDNAGGIPEGIIDRVFEPYFTTKEQGKGTGIGLYMSKVIIEQNMGGKLTARNINGGAEFRIEI